MPSSASDPRPLGVVLCFLLSVCVLSACGGPQFDSFNAVARTVQFAGFEWQMRGETGAGGPGSNLWGSSEQSIALSDDGLVLTLHPDGDAWRSAEVRTALPRGTVRVEFDIELASGEVANNIVLGLFVYRDDSHEADFECTQWGDPAAEPWQFALARPAGAQVERFSLGTTAESSHVLRWRRRTVEWRSSSEGVSHSWSERLAPGRRLNPAYIHINLWLHQRRPPGDGTRSVRVTDVRAYDRRGRRLTGGP